jgi:hypothetical protein
MDRPRYRGGRRRARFSSSSSLAVTCALCCVIGATCGVVLAAEASGTSTSTTLSLRTRDARASDTADVYLYTSLDVSSHGQSYVTAFEPRAERATVHHMLLYGCKRAAASGLDKVVGGMFTNGARVATCADGTSQALLYGWGRNAPPMHMPDEVGFRVGAGSGAFAALVLEVHYLEKQDASSEGESGLDVVISSGKPAKSASMLAWASYFSLNPGKEEALVRATCTYEASRALKAFSFRVHTHERGTRVWLDRLVGGDPDKPVRILERDPLLPQEFEELSKSGTDLTVTSGDALRVTCSFDTRNESSVVSAGFGAAHEMCNMYIMVYSDEPQYLSCLGRNDGKTRPFDVEVGDEASKATEDLAKVSTFAVSPPKDVSSWPKLGGVGGIETTADGTHVWVTNRGSNVWEAGSDLSAAKVIEEDAVVRVNLQTGQVDKSFGANAHVMPHGIRVAPDKSVWVTDTALHQVFKYSEDGRLVRAFGVKGEKRSGGEGFCAPSDVLVLEDGSFLVADGYGLCPNRIARFDAQGNFEKDLDMEAVTPKVKVAHQLAYSQLRAEVAMADRENSRVILFDYHGKSNTVIDLSEHGYVYGLAWMGSALEGLRGYYVLCWRRDDANPKTTLVRIFWPSTAASTHVIHAWDLKDSGVDFETPHVLALQSSKNGGTESWGPGLTIHVGSTTATKNNYARLWLGVKRPGVLSIVSPVPSISSTDDQTPSHTDTDWPSQSTADATARSAPSRRSAAAILAVLVVAFIIVRQRRARHRPTAHARPRDIENVVLTSAAALDPDDDDILDDEVVPASPRVRSRVKLAKD